MIYLYSIIEGLFFTDFFSHSQITKEISQARYIGKASALQKFITWAVQFTGINLQICWC